jgi:hypothetical protein
MFLLFILSILLISVYFFVKVNKNRTGNPGDVRVAGSVSLLLVTEGTCFIQLVAVSGNRVILLER